ncbi:MAG: hypothetical protein QW776_02715 [Candidatus Nitrosocaldus sp.]
MDGIAMPCYAMDKHLLHLGKEYNHLNLFKRKTNNGNNVCEYCNVEFQDREHLERHKKVAHRKGR